MLFGDGSTVGQWKDVSQLKRRQLTNERDVSQFSREAFTMLCGVLRPLLMRAPQTRLGCVCVCARLFGVGLNLATRSTRCRFALAWTTPSVFYKSRFCSVTKLTQVWGSNVNVPTVWLCGHPAEPALAKNESGRVDLGVQRVVAHGGDPTVRTCLLCSTHAGALLEHMKGFHQRYLCLLCVEGRPLFLSEQEVFTASELRKHEARVEGGHPLCRFCSKR